MKKMREHSCLRDIAEIIAAVVIFGILLALFLWMIRVFTGYAREAWASTSLEADDVSEDAGVGRVTASLKGVYLLGEETYAEGEKTALRVYTEGVDSPLPPWWDPKSAELVWADHIGEANKMVDGGCPDWNANTSLSGWGGRTMEVWELDLFARIFYLEFWQPNLMLCEAGCDAMLGLWDLEGGTMFETLSHINEDGSYSFSTYPGVWEAEYDPDGLAWCREYCEERFYEGPSWPAQYFRKGQYHDWGEWSPIPAYEIEGIYFSIGR